MSGAKLFDWILGGLVLVMIAAMIYVPIAHVTRQPECRERAVPIGGTVLPVCDAGAKLTVESGVGVCRCPEARP